MENDYESMDRILARELGQGERLLWSGRPRGGFRLYRHDLMLVPFSLLWCGFMVFWMTAAVRGDAPGFFLAFGGVFCLIGLYLLVGRFFYDAWRRGRTIYGLTDRRAIVLTGGAQVDSVALDDTGPLTLTERPDGSGRIEFGAAVQGMYGVFRGSGWPMMDRFLPPAFEDIEDVRRVYRMALDSRKVGA